MADQAEGHKQIPFGVASLLVMAVLLLYSFLPTRVRPIPPLFLLTLLFGVVVSLLSAIIAGLKGSRLWFFATLLPIAFFFMLLNFEQSTEVQLAGESGRPIFALSGSGTLTEFVVFSPEYLTTAESPHDMRFALWCVQPVDHEGWGVPVWKLKSIRYGVVPQGYIQCAPLEGRPEPLRDSQAPYLLSMTTASAPGVSEYFIVEAGKARSMKSPPEGPCFKMEHGTYKRAQCIHSSPCETDSQSPRGGSC